MKRIKVHSPASVANLVCGFDILGLALCEPYDEMELIATDKPGIVIKHLDMFGLSVLPEENVAGVVLLSMLEKLQSERGFELILKKNIKPGSGIGSSAASAAGAAVAANHLLGNIFSNEELLQFAMNGEKLASGVKHADNIAPCIYGGVTLVRSINPPDIVPLASPDLFVTIVHPQIEVRTSDARQILKEKILLKDAIKQWGNIAGLVAGFVRNDPALIGRSMVDVIIEPARSILIPGFDRTRQLSMEAGAIGGGISGSGPSIFMLSLSRETAVKVEDAMKTVYTEIGIDFFTYVTTISKKGVEVIECH